MIGLVYYQDDPTKAVFRQVFPQPRDIASEVFSDPQWTTVGCDPARVAVLVQIDETAATAGVGDDGVTPTLTYLGVTYPLNGTP